MRRLGSGSSLGRGRCLATAVLLAMALIVVSMNGVGCTKRFRCERAIAEYWDPEQDYRTHPCVERRVAKGVECCRRVEVGEGDEVSSGAQAQVVTERMAVCIAQAHAREEQSVGYSAIAPGPGRPWEVVLLKSCEPCGCGQPVGLSVVVLVSQLDGEVVGTGQTNRCLPCPK